MPVVKADAYNHGAVEVSRILVSQGVRFLAVASAEEGVALRRAGIKIGIVILSDFLPSERDLLVQYDLAPVLYAVAHVREFSALATKAGRVLPFHLKVDTGLTRLGMLATGADIVEQIRNTENVSLQGVMTHLASAEDFDSPQSASQIDRFSDICAALMNMGSLPELLHMSSTNAIAYGRRDAWHSMVRPGLSLYGYVSPASGIPAERLLQVEPVLTWKASVLSVKDIPEGSLIGYGGSYRTTRPSRIAVLAAGYADGYPHSLGNVGQVIVNSRLAPIRGAVSMDLITIDVTDCPPVAPGDAAVLLGNTPEASMNAQDIADLAGTIPYVILCSIGRRVKRVYVD
jgi:alanine racemase